MARVGERGMSELTMSGIAVEFGATVLLRDVTFSVERGER